MALESGQDATAGNCQSAKSAAPVALRRRFGPLSSRPRRGRLGMIRATESLARFVRVHPGPASRHPEIPIALQVRPICPSSGIQTFQNLPSGLAVAVHRHSPCTRRQGLARRVPAGSQNLRPPRPLPPACRAQSLPTISDRGWSSSALVACSSSTSRPAPAPTIRSASAHPVDQPMPRW